MKRKIYSALLEWKNHRADKEAILIDGARRIGKSYIIEEFARNEYKSYILVDFSKITSEMREIFDHYLPTPDEFFTRLQLWAGTKLYEKESIIIFDEVQRYPKAREAIKWLVADGRYHFAETGSLVGLRKNVKGITLPSEEYHVDMFPMDFEEFLWAMGEEMLMPFIVDCAKKMVPLGQSLHRKAMDYLRLYMVIGGMPQAISEYLSSRDFDNVDHIKRNILTLYRNDIFQYAGNEAAKVALIYDSIPAQLQRHEKRFRMSEVKQGARRREYAEAFFWLEEARVVNPCYAATAPSIGLKLNRDDARYKLYFCDTGLLISHAFDEAEIRNSGLYRKLILDKLEINKGMLVENLAAQMIRASHCALYYYSNVDHKNYADNMEIDFLVRKSAVTSRHNICPIEVKSSSRYTTSSLNKFREKYASYLHTAYILHSGDLKVENEVVYMPLYMSGLITG